MEKKRLVLRSVLICVAGVGILALSVFATGFGLRFVGHGRLIIATWYYPSQAVASLALLAALRSLLRMHRQRWRTWTWVWGALCLVACLALQVTQVVVATAPNKHRYHEGISPLYMIVVGARAYFEADHYSANGDLLPRRFPPSTSWTPAQDCCRSADQPWCPAGDRPWNAATWKALQFRMDGPHHYQYRFVSSGTGADATFTAMIRGDADCDGDYATIRYEGSVRIVNQRPEVSVRGPILTNEIE